MADPPALKDEADLLATARLDAYRAAFQADPLPALLFEMGRLVIANEACRRAFAHLDNASAFIALLRVTASGLCATPEPILEINGAKYRASIHPKPVRSLPRSVICRLIPLAGSAPLAASGLTPRELVVADLLTKGLSNARIAEELGVSTETVRKHLAHAFRKTGIKSRVGLVARALNGSSAT